MNQFGLGAAFRYTKSNIALRAKLARAVLEVLHAIFDLISDPMYSRQRFLWISSGIRPITVFAFFGQLKRIEHAVGLHSLPIASTGSIFDAFQAG